MNRLVKRRLRELVPCAALAIDTKHVFCSGGSVSSASTTEICNELQVRSLNYRRINFSFHPFDMCTVIKLGKRTTCFLKQLKTMGVEV